MQRVYIANFGRQNYEWPECLARGTIATMNREASHPFWVAGDREGYINYQMNHTFTAAGIRPTRPVASRWFNLMTIISDSEGDLWIHREKDQLWWTRSTSEPAEIAPGVDPSLPGDQRVLVCHKPCDPWSNHNLKGHRLDWASLHPKAKEFLFTEGTLQQIAEDNAEYAVALIEGADLSPWHSRGDWKAKLANAKAAPTTVFNAIQRAAARMAMQALSTAAASNGQEVTRTVKNKEVRFTREDLEKYLVALIESQERLCALTELPLQLDGEHDDAEMLPSLDRIDSDGHYEEGNLQVVCRFANRWKNNDKDVNFRRLIGVLRAASSASRET
jgi:hypothetical protein